MKEGGKKEGMDVLPNWPHPRIQDFQRWDWPGSIWFLLSPITNWPRPFLAKERSTFRLFGEFLEQAAILKKSCFTSNGESFFMKPHRKPTLPFALIVTLKYWFFHYPPAHCLFVHIFGLFGRRVQKWFRNKLRYCSNVNWPGRSCRRDTSTIFVCMEPCFTRVWESFLWKRVSILVI